MFRRRRSPAARSKGKRVTGWVGELHRDDVVLARVLWWRGEAQSELPTVRPKVAAAALRRR
jgi:hypothetical protein